MPAVVMKALRALLVLVGIVVIAGNFTGGGLVIRSAALGIAAAVTVARVILVKEERFLWAICAVALCAWTGQLYYIVVPNAPVTFPALPDYMALVFYAAALVSIVLLVKSRLRDWRNSLWLDGVIGGLALSALMSLFVFQAALHGSGVETQIVDGQLGYAISDLFILGFLGAIALLARWRLGLGGWGFIAAFSLLALADSLYVSAVANDQLLPSSLVTSLWAGGSLTLAATATTRRRLARAGNAAGIMPIALLGLSAMSSLCLLVAYRIGLAEETPALTALATTVLAVVVVRFCLTLLENSRMLKESRTHALTDSLTWLPNRRALMRDLESQLTDASEERQLTLALFDLDGFKQYNDTFGHPAGDALLARLGGKLQQALEGSGRAYRLGGDEFCVLVAVDANSGAEIAWRAASALSERGEGFDVGCSYGVASFPRDASTAVDALSVADQHMYERKAGRASASRQSTDVLLKALNERNPGLGEHTGVVAQLAKMTAQGLGLDEHEGKRIELAGELHDIGKVAIPETILNKPGPLDEEEWEFMHRHTLIGERILIAAPSLAQVAELVRSSHERHDGGGYPDRLAGEDIPLGASIIAVCDAFDAMTSERPYSAALSVADALAELRRCSGSQFRPRVVRAFCELIERPDSLKRETAETVESTFRP